MIQRQVESTEGNLPLQLLTEPYVNLSTHTALVIQPPISKLADEKTTWIFANTVFATTAPKAFGELKSQMQLESRKLYKVYLEFNNRTRPNRGVASFDFSVSFWIYIAKIRFNMCDGEFYELY